MEDQKIFLALNSSTQSWLNSSSSDYSDVATQGAAHFVSSFRPSGLLFVLGGSVGNGSLIGFDFLYFFEPISQRWSSQKVSRTLPKPVSNPCIAGLPGENGTYEVGRSSLLFKD